MRTLSGLMSLMDAKNYKNIFMNDKEKFHRPMDITKIVDRFNRNDTFGHVKSGDIFGKYIVFHEHGHQISSG